MKFTTNTLGCKVNIYETEALIGSLSDRGWNYVENEDDVDVYIINTCTVTSTSDQKSRQMIRQARRKFPNAIIVAMGCFTQTNPETAVDLADIVLGTNDRLKVYELVNSYIDTKRQIKHIFDINDFTKYDEMKLERLTKHTRGFVKIQDGCENFCSYCLIPYARGPIKSRDANSIIHEINELILQGTKEIIISGINTGTYGQDLEDINLAKLIELIMTKTELVQLRLSSIELMEVSDELLDTIKKYESRIANHLHIPLQGGTDSVLKRMKRKYITNDYEKLIEKIRNIFPNIAITTDYIAGFVGETEEEFNEAYAFIKKIDFASMHVFPYSRRKKTEADKLSGHLNPSTIKERAKKVIELAKIMKLNYMNKFVNCNVSVLLEQKKGNYIIGHTSNYLEVYVPYDESLKDNMIIDVKLTRLNDEILYGEVIKED